MCSFLCLIFTVLSYSLLVDFNWLSFLVIPVLILVSFVCLLVIISGDTGVDFSLLCVSTGYYFR